MIDIELTPVMTGVIMPGGYHYKENGKMVVDEAESYVDLINKLARYRAANQLPLGNPQADVDQYICTTFPNMCGPRTFVVQDQEGVDPVELSYGVPITKSPRERVMQWAANRMQRSGEIELVDADTADARMAICDGCPKKRQWNEPIEGCPGCQAYVYEAESYLVRIRQNKLTAYVNSGRMCDVAGHDLETAVWLEEAGLRHRKNYVGKFPEFCWLRDLHERKEITVGHGGLETKGEIHSGIERESGGVGQDLREEKKRPRRKRVAKRKQESPAIPEK